jgi:quercetin dioxygenase-like cupin family protein
MSTATIASEPRWFIQNLVYVRARGAETGGSYSLVELAGPQGDMPPLHLHRDEDEAFFVLEGTLTLFLADDEIRLEAGESAVAPRGVPHVYRVDSPRARWLGVASPTFAEFVLAASVPAEAETLPTVPPAFSPDELGALAAAHGIEILGPPGTLPSSA